MRAPRFAVAALLACVVSTPAARGRTPPQTPLRDSRLFASGVEVTGIAATVTDAEGHLIVDLPRDAFAVFEDGEPQTVTQFTRERVPIGLGVLLDTSDSMFGRRLQDARAAVDRFLFELLTADDEFFVFAFNHRPRPLTGWTRSQDEVQRALRNVQPFGGTALYDTILDALPLVEHRARQRAALVLISDGADTASNATIRNVRSALLRSDAFVYAIGIDSPDRKAINTRVNAQALREITADTGGRVEIVHTSADLAEATGRIAEELNSQYVLGYTSTHGDDGQFHSIRVRASRQAEDGSTVTYRVRARNGYVRTPVRPHSR